MPLPLVSIIVPCHNYGRYLAESVGSALAQSINDIEVIIVDDGSTDDTAAVSARFEDPRVRVIRHATNQGLTAALVTGLLAAQGEYIARIDADDRYRPYFLKEALGLFAAHPEIGMVYGDVAAMDEQGHITENPWQGIRSHAAHGGRDFCGDEFLANVEDNVIPTPAMIARRQAYLGALPFPDGFDSSVSDWYLNVRIARAYPVYYRALTLGDYRLHPLNMHRQPQPVLHTERTIIGVLDEMFSGEDRRAAKRAARRRVYSRAYTSFANQYFALEQRADARRCYLRALRYRPDHGLRWRPLRLLAATFLPPTLYRQIKRVVR